MFDPQTYLDASLTAPSTRRPPVPTGDYPGVIQEPKSRAWQSRDGSKSGIAVDVPVKLTLPPDVTAALGVSEVTISDSIMLDLTESGTIDNSPGKNTKLRRYREALDLNKPGDTFSFRMLQGRFLTAKIKHDLYEGEIYDRIESVSRG